MPWPTFSVFEDLSFCEILPDLQPQFLHAIRAVPSWNQETITKVNIFVDGSSFTNRNAPDQGVAAWAFVVVVETSDPTRSFRFHSAAHHRLSGANEPNESFLGIGEFCHDSLSAEAVAMVWALTWILQSNLACQFEVFYDNCTIGQYVAGQSQWK